MKGLLLTLIRLYRKYISPATPPNCRFLPTCSQYALEAIQIHGALKGSLLALRRLLKCHPLHRQKTFQFDPVPLKHPRQTED